MINVTFRPIKKGIRKVSFKKIKKEYEKFDKAVKRQFDLHYVCYTIRNNFPKHIYMKKTIICLFVVKF